MLIELELLKKESNMIIGANSHEYEKCAIKLSTLMSAGKNDQRPDEWTDAMFAGLPSTLTVNEPFDKFIKRVDELTLRYNGGK